MAAGALPAAHGNAADPDAVGVVAAVTVIAKHHLVLQVNANALVHQTCAKCMYKKTSNLFSNTNG